MKDEVKIISDLRHARRNKNGVIMGMTILTCFFASVGSLTQFTNKRISWMLTGTALCVLAAGGTQIFRLERREADLSRRLEELRRNRQNG